MTEETLFARALERPAGADREAFLDAACGMDAALRVRVERLLAADDRSRGILDEHACPGGRLAVSELATAGFVNPRAVARAGEWARDAVEADPPGYELTERVGAGGMGVVYRARDMRLHREVAVKNLQPSIAAGGPPAGRSLGEARATAQVQAPAIPPAHEVGWLPDGRPFLVMKLIRGRTLAELLSSEGTDRGELLAAFEGVCQAVGFAHAHRVIHRDLKPANVMVGAFGEVQVVD